jgi:hypothetical protein
LDDAHQLSVNVRFIRSHCPLQRTFNRLRCAAAWRRIDIPGELAPQEQKSPLRKSCAAEAPTDTIKSPATQITMDRKVSTGRSCHTYIDDRRIKCRFHCCRLQGELLAVEAINHVQDYAAARNPIEERLTPVLEKLSVPGVDLQDSR